MWIDAAAGAAPLVIDAAHESHSLTKLRHRVRSCHKPRSRGDSSSNVASQAPDNSYVNVT